MTVTKDDELVSELAAVQTWNVEGEMREWVEPYLLVGFITKMVSNFRGDEALGVFLGSIGSASTSNYQLTDEVSEPGGIYAVQAFLKPNGTPFIQTPTSQGSRRFRDLEVSGVSRGLMNTLRRNGSDSAVRVDAAMRLVDSLGRELANAPSARLAAETTMNIMLVLERDGVVPRLLS